MKKLIYLLPLIVASLIPQFWRFMTWQLEWTGQTRDSNMDHAVMIMVVVGIVTFIVGFIRAVN